MFEFLHSNTWAGRYDHNKDNDKEYVPDTNRCHKCGL